MKMIANYWPEALRTVLSLVYLAAMPASTPPIAMLIVLGVIWLSFR